MMMMMVMVCCTLFFVSLPQRREIHGGAILVSRKPSGLNNLERKGISMTEFLKFFSRTLL